MSVIGTYVALPSGVQSHAEAPWFIVINAGSGRQNTERTSQIITEELVRAKREHLVFFARRGRDVQAMADHAVSAARKHAGHVVVAGGDGTINTVANAAYRANCGLGIIPLGTFNYTARTYGIPQDPAAATRALMDATLRKVQTGMINDRVFLVNAGLGFHSYLLAQREKHKAKLGRSRTVALLSALISIADLPTRLALELDHDGRKEALSVSALFVGNNPLQLQQTGLIDAEQLPPHSLLAVALDPVGPLQALGLLWRGALGRLGEDEHLRRFSLHEMTVNRRKHSNRPFRVAIDGEIHTMRGPLTFRTAPQSLQMLIPPTGPR